MTLACGSGFKRAQTSVCFKQDHRIKHTRLPIEQDNKMIVSATFACDLNIIYSLCMNHQLC
jgi:hypothetical protein